MFCVYTESKEGENIFVLIFSFTKSDIQKKFRLLKKLIDDDACSTKKICERLQVKWNDSEIVNCFRFSVMSLGVDEEIGWDRVLCDIGCWL